MCSVGQNALSLADGSHFLEFPVQSQGMVRGFALRPRVAANKAPKPSLLHPIRPCLRYAWCPHPTICREHGNMSKSVVKLGNGAPKLSDIPTSGVAAPHDHISKVYLEIVETHTAFLQGKDEGRQRRCVHRGSTWCLQVSTMKRPRVNRRVGRRKGRVGQGMEACA